MSNSANNKRNGTEFEKIFFQHAKIQNLTPIQNHISARYLYNGRLQPIKSELDFKLIKNGITGFFDCKSFEHNYFNYSQICPKQLERSVLYNHLNVPSGFIVYFRSINQIYFFKGYKIAKSGPGSKIIPEIGKLLGSISKMSLAQLFN